MTTRLITLEVFVASPGDVAKERQAIGRVVRELERSIGSVIELNLRPFLWEHDLGPGVHAAGPQGLVDAHSNLAKCDVLVGVFWNRLGTPTAAGKTGTEHELSAAYARWKRTGRPHIMVYFSKRPIPQTSASLEQGTLLLEFRQALPKEVLSWEYRSHQEFERLFREHLTRHIMHVWNERGRPADHVRFANSQLALGLVESGPHLIQTNADIVSEAEEIFYATGSRSRDEKYLKAIEARLAAVPALVHYRVLMGPPFRALLKEHLLRLLQLRPPGDRSLGFKTLHVGLFEKPLQQAEVFIAGNEKRALIVLPSRQGLGEYNNGLVVDDPVHARDLCNFVKQMYAAGRPIETTEAIEALPALIG